MSEEPIKEDTPDKPEAPVSRITDELRDRLKGAIENPDATFLLLATVGTEAKPFLSYSGDLSRDQAITFAIRIYLGLVGHDPNLAIKGMQAISAELAARSVPKRIIVPGRDN